jgi:8-oxo-dGTP diphosphatase
MMDSASSGRPSFPVGINVIVVRDGRILLGKRKNVYGEGDWGLPGGHLEYGEDMKDAAARELEEETGLKARHFEFHNLVNDTGGRKNKDTYPESHHYLQIGFIAQGILGEPELLEPDKCFEWKWFDLDALPENVLASHKQNIELFKKKRNFGE